MAAYIHHVQLFTKNGTKYVQKFVQNADFRLFAKRSTEHLKQWAVRSGSAVFIINQHVLDSDVTGEPGNPISTNLASDSHQFANRSSSCSAPYKHDKKDQFCKQGSQQLPINCREIPASCFSLSAGNKWDRNIDTVFNVALEVCDVEKTVDRAQRNGANIICEPTVVQDNSGKVTIASVQSCIGNVVHTLLNTKDYHGVFLPGFHSVSNDLHIKDTAETQEEQNDIDSEQAGKALISHIDHITYACHKGASGHILDWYEKCFGMKRFKLSSEEDDVDGFLVQGDNIGLRMKAMEYWHCAEIGLAMPTEGSRHPKAKFVIAEALPGQGPNQVETFLEGHNGSGIQHIGLYAPHIVDTVKHLRNTGLNFIQPPASYYTEIGKLTEIVNVGEDTETLKQLGILLDAESFTADDASGNVLTKCNGTAREDSNDLLHRYLMQIFTKPIFERDTFFLEIIQRCGATGFGAGNITALWRAVESYMEQDKMKDISS